ncbi:hypothetical protein PZ61_0235925 [Streptomyces sp. MNU77]|uniref:FUSC family protein n=1 Tax=Streptomyces sp. MNU77 TaxID=1573406 RepID=UPI0005DE4DBF|nr:FUSC family protein [Streptomyces sp. MNU77]OLO25823.1 hypothetical protein PZ61_0235925 [Streptomyces sp. MNU77]
MRATQRRLRRFGHWVTGADPGLGRLLTGLRVFVGMGVSMLSMYAFIEVTGVLQDAVPPHASPAARALLEAQHYQATVLAVTLGALVGLLCATQVPEEKPSGSLVTVLLIPVPALVTLWLSIKLAHHHWWGLAGMAVAVALGMWVRRFVSRWGTRVVTLGVMLFTGYFIGFMGGGHITEGQIGGIATVLWTAAGVNLVLKLTLYPLLAAGRTARTSRTMTARCHAVLAAAGDFLDLPAEHRAVREAAARARLRQRLTRLNETALIIDGSLGTPAARHPGWSARQAHEHVLDMELTVQRMVRHTVRLAGRPLPPSVHHALRGGLDLLAHGDTLGGVRSLREAAADAEREELADDIRQALCHLCEAACTWRGHLILAREGRCPAPGPDDAAATAADPYRSAVHLHGGGLPGTAVVGAAAAVQHPVRSMRRLLRMDASAQLAVRLAVAVAVAGTLGTLLDQDHFHWAVVAVFVSFNGTNTSLEQFAKGVYRVFGTVTGVLLGALLADAIGRSAWSMLVVCAAMATGIYLAKVHYLYTVTAVTVSVSQMYAQNGSYSHHALELRLAESAVGAAVAMAAALLIFPVATHHATRLAHDTYVRSLADLLQGVTVALLRPLDPASSESRNAPAPEGFGGHVRALEHALHQYTAAVRARPWWLVLPRTARHDPAPYESATHAVRALAVSVHRSAPLERPVRDEIAGALVRERIRLLRPDEGSHPLTPEAATTTGARQAVRAASPAGQGELLSQLDLVLDRMAPVGPAGAPGTPTGTGGKAG